MKNKTFTTKEIADIVNVHPNTVRLYEEWGYISRVNRRKNGYRVFTSKHLYQMKLARIALPGPYPIDVKIVQELVKEFAKGEYEKALSLAKNYLEGVDMETIRAKAALEILDKWFEKKPGDKEKIVFKTRKKASNELGVSVDALRTWERNDLFSINKDCKGRMVFTEWDIEKIMIIRLLRNCGYSIASLFRVFSNEENLYQKPSEVLSLPDDNSDIYYVTDQFLKYLKDHRKRAEKVIALVSEV